MTISPPLCLDPNPQLARLVNSVLRVSTPNVPKSLKRKATAMVDLEEDETEKARRTKILQFMNPQLTSRKPKYVLYCNFRSFIDIYYHYSYKTLDFIEQRRAAIKQNPIPPTNHPENIPVGLQRNLMATYSNGGSAPQITPNVYPYTSVALEFIILNPFYSIPVITRSLILQMEPPYTNQIQAPFLYNRFHNTYKPYQPLLNEHPQPNYSSNNQTSLLHRNLLYNSLHNPLLNLLFHNSQFISLLYNLPVNPLQLSKRLIR